MMAIFWGKKGAGKTANAVNRIVQQYRNGLDTVTNIHINPDALPKTKTPGRIFKTNDPDDLAYFRGTKRAPVLFVYDEAYLKFNSRNWKELKNSTHELMAQSRKIGCEVIIIAQGFKRIDIVLREITDVFVRFQPALWGFGYHEIQEELSMFEENKLVPFGSETSKETGLGTIRLHKRKNWHVYDTDQLFGSLLTGLSPKEFEDIVTGRKATFPTLDASHVSAASRPKHGRDDGAPIHRKAWTWQKLRSKLKPWKEGQTKPNLLNSL